MRRAWYTDVTLQTFFDLRWKFQKIYNWEGDYYCIQTPFANSNMSVALASKPEGIKRASSDLLPLPRDIKIFRPSRCTNSLYAARQVSKSQSVLWKQDVWKLFDGIGCRMRRCHKTLKTAWSDSLLDRRVLADKYLTYKYYVIFMYFRLTEKHKIN